jgi:hypothetical protein
MHVPSLRLRIAPSPLLAIVLLLAHAAAIACAARYLPGWWLPALASLAIAGSLVFHVRQDALQLSSHAVTGLLLKNDGQCELTLRNGETLAGSIEGSTFVTPQLTVVNVRPGGQGRRRSVILVPGRAPAEDLRRARVWLRHRVQADKPGSGSL